MPQPKPDPSLFTPAKGEKAPKPWENDAEWLSYRAHPCRVRTGTVLILYYLGWDPNWPIQGHACRYWSGSSWGAPERILAADLRRTEPCELPGPIPEEKN